MFMQIKLVFEQGFVLKPRPKVNRKWPAETKCAITNTDTV